MKNYKIGDRVKATLNINTKTTNGIKTGYTGTVIGFHKMSNWVCVEFDTFINGHDGNDSIDKKGKMGHCYYLHYGDITSITETKIVITTDGTETLARLYEDNKVIKTATAKCSPEDEVNFETGAKIAFDRLVGNKPAEYVKPKYYNGKVVCIESRDKDFTVGKVYKFTDGYTRDNDNDKRPAINVAITNLDEFPSSYKFIPLVE